MFRRQTQQREQGFTLIEMLVVIAIVVMVATTSAVFFIQFTQSRGLRENGRLFESAFNRAHRLASSTGDAHFLIVEDESGSQPVALTIVRDMDGEGSLGTFNTNPDVASGEDKLVDQVELADFIEVQVGTDTGAAPLLTSKDSGHYWIKFGSDGSITGASEDPSDPRIAYKKNRTWRETANPPTETNGDYDFYLKRQATGQMFFDWEPVVGKIVAKYYTG